MTLRPPSLFCLPLILAMLLPALPAFGQASAAPREKPLATRFPERVPTYQLRRGSIQQGNTLVSESTSTCHTTVPRYVVRRTTCLPCCRCGYLSIHRNCNHLLVSTTRTVVVTTRVSVAEQTRREASASRLFPPRTAWDYLDDRDLESAAKLFRERIAQSPSDAEARIGYALILLKHDHRYEANSQLRRAARLSGGDLSSVELPESGRDAVRSFLENRAERRPHIAELLEQLPTDPLPEADDFAESPDNGGSPDPSQTSQAAE